MEGRGFIQQSGAVAAEHHCFGVVLDSANADFQRFIELLHGFQIQRTDITAQVELIQRDKLFRENQRIAREPKVPANVDVCWQFLFSGGCQNCADHRMTVSVAHIVGKNHNGTCTALGASVDRLRNCVLQVCIVQVSSKNRSSFHVHAPYVYPMTEIAF